MAHINFTPLTTLAFDTLDHWERAYHVAVMRATCDCRTNARCRCRWLLRRTCLLRPALGKRPGSFSPVSRFRP